jgi:tight adherence protein C
MDLGSIGIGIGVVIAIIIVGALVYIGLRENDDRDPLYDRLAELGEREMPQSLEEVELSLSFQDRVLIPLLKRIAEITRRFTPEKQIEETRKLLEMAGMSGQMEPHVFLTIRAIAAIFLLAAAFFVFFASGSSFFGPTMRMGMTVGAGVLGFVLPVMWLQSKISKRQLEIIRALPDAMDLLVICVEAGLGFDAAMGKVYEKWDNDLALAFGRVLREIQLGKLRREAMKDMATRLDVPDLTSFVAAIVQAESLGVSMAQILRVQSDQMRVKRRQRAEEIAQAAPVKMMIPMVLLIFPSIWIVLLGPAMINVWQSGALSAF